MKKAFGLAVTLLIVAIFLIPTATKASPASGLDNLVASTYLGGSAGDVAYAVVLDSSNNIYIASVSNSTNFPTTTGAYQGISGGGYDAVVSKFNSSLTSLLASTYLGGSGNDFFYGIILDSLNNIYI